MTYRFWSDELLPGLSKHLPNGACLNVARRVFYKNNQPQPKTAIYVGWSSTSKVIVIDHPSPGPCSTKPPDFST